MYIGTPCLTMAVPWKTYEMLGQRNRYRGYADYAEKGVDEDIKRFYSNNNILSMLWSKEYRELRQNEVKDSDILTLRNALQDRPEIKEVLNLVSKIIGLKSLDLIKPSKKSTANSAKRAFAIYACKNIFRCHLQSHRGIFQLVLKRLFLSGVSCRQH